MVRVHELEQVFDLASWVLPQVPGDQGAGLGWRALFGMDAAEWLRLVEDAVHASLPNVEISRPDDDMLTLALGARGVVLQVSGNVALLAPSFAAGGTIGSRLQDRVQHLERTSYGLTREAASAAASAVLGHLHARG